MKIVRYSIWLKSTWMLTFLLALRRLLASLCFSSFSSLCDLKHFTFKLWLSLTFVVSFKKSLLIFSFASLWWSFPFFLSVFGSIFESDAFESLIFCFLGVETGSSKSVSSVSRFRFFDFFFFFLLSGLGSSSGFCCSSLFVSFCSAKNAII